MRRLLFPIFLGCAFSFSAGHAQSISATAMANQYIAGSDDVSVTKHQLNANGKVLAYTATSGYLHMTDENKKPKAKIFFTAYTLDGTRTPAERAITFIYNGGPGSSSVWLHMGGLGPKRILMTDNGEAMAPPYEIVDNPDTWLEASDLVFIDPVETGYSRPAEGEDKKQFLGYQEDLASVGDFIRAYTSRYERWASPKYLSGESYGTTRSAGLSGYLQDRYGFYLNGIILISSIMNFGTTNFEKGNDLPYAMFLPTYAAIAAYHNALPQKPENLEAFLQEVRQYALGEYTTMLMKGDRMTQQEKDQVADKLNRYTGLSKKYLAQTNYRIAISRFVKELLREKGLTVGRLDGRFTGMDYDDAGEAYEFDPSYSAAIYGPYAMAINDHLKRTLKVKIDLPYEILTGRVRPWNYSNVQNSYLNNSETLRNAIHKNPYLKVLIINGYYDLATPFFATEYTVDHMFLDPSLRNNISMKYYPSGHMVYIHKPSLLQMNKDVKAFYKDTLPKK